MRNVCVYGEKEGRPGADGRSSIRVAAGIRNQCQLNLGRVGSADARSTVRRCSLKRRSVVRSTYSDQGARAEAARGPSAPGSSREERREGTPVSSADQLTPLVGCEHGIEDIGGARGGRA
jgi:hypothetical protein